MNKRTELMGLALAAAVVIVGVVVFAFISTKSSRDAVQREAQQTKAALQEASALQVSDNETRPRGTSDANEQSPSRGRANVAESSRSPVSLADTQRAASLAAKRARVLAEGAQVDTEPLPGLQEPVESDAKADVLPTEIPAGNLPTLDPVDRAADNAPALKILDDLVREGAAAEAAGEEGTEIAQDRADSTPTDRSADKEKEALVDEPQPLDTANPSENVDATAELAAMQDVQSHLKRLHSLLLRTDIPPAARAAEKKRLEAALARLSPETRRAVDALVKDGYAARLSGAKKKTLAPGGEALKDHDFGRKDEQPSDVRAVEARIQGLRRRLGATPSGRVPRRTGGGYSSSTLPSSPAARLRSVGTGQVGGASARPSTGVLPAASASDL